MKTWTPYSDRLGPCTRAAGPTRERAVSQGCGPPCLAWASGPAVGEPRGDRRSPAGSSAFRWHGGLGRSVYLVSMLGSAATGVLNVRAADGRAVLKHGQPRLPARRGATRRAPGDPAALPADGPGSRPHIPVDRQRVGAGLRGHRAAVPRLPRGSRRGRRVMSEPRRPGRPGRWRRWLLAGVACSSVLVVGGAAIFVKSQPSAAPLTLSIGRRPAPGRPGRRHLGRGRGDRLPVSHQGEPPRLR